MDNQEAIKELSELLDGCCGGEEIEPTRQAIRLAISALEKQIPKKLIADGDGYADGSMVYDSFYCPSCDHRMEEDEVEDYCPNCGQKICWEDDG